MNRIIEELPNSNYSGPGQALDDLVSHFSVDELKVILGNDIYSLIESLTEVTDKISVLQKITVDFFFNHYETLFTQEKIRNICLNALSANKLQELSSRLGLSDPELLSTFQPNSNKENWQRFIGFFGIDTRTAIPFIPPPNQEPIPVEYGLFPHQRDAANRVYGFLKGGYGRVVLHMPTGSGKTRTAMHITSRFLNEVEPAVIVWLASSAELLEQAAEAFQSAWANLGNRDVEIIRCWGAHEPENLAGISDGLVIAGLQKMHSLKTKYPLEFMRFSRLVKFVIVDEAHQAIAPTYKALIDTISNVGSNNALLGLTATPGRSWSKVSEDEKLSQFFGENKVMLEVEGWDDPVSYLIETGYLARPTFKQLECPSDQHFTFDVNKVASCEEYEEALLNSLAENTERTRIIIDEALRLISNGHKRLILFASSVRHAEILSAAFSALGISSSVVTGQTDKNLRARIIKEFRAGSQNPMILCNFGVLTTGFDAPNTSAAIIARPTKSLVLYSQMVGRAIRGPRAGGNETCEISTVVDVGLPGFGDIAQAFTNWEDVWE